MLTVESLEILTKKITECSDSDKTIIKEVINSVKEFIEVENQITKLKKIITLLIEEKQIKKYIKIDENIYCLKTFREVEIISASEKDLERITNIENKIKKECSEIEKIINESDNRLDSLESQKTELLTQLCRNDLKAINTELILCEGELTLIFHKD